MPLGHGLGDFNLKRSIGKRGIVAATALALLGASVFVAPAWARSNHALLVAVTAYPNLPPKAALIGPNHDAVLVRDYLTNAAPVKFDDVTLLADGVDGAKASPTRDAILASLRELAGKVRRDDFVYLHFSGHGAQQPETVIGNETDGLDEIFLPADTGKWVDQTRGVPNALMDDDIGAALDAIRDKGAFVWVIFDACHSGSATRAAPVGEDGYVERKLEFEDLGIPAEAVKEAAARAKPADTAQAGQREPAFTLSEEPASRAVPLGGQQSATGAESIAKGGMVAFFAAQTIETTPEMPLPRGKPDAERYGLFTYTLFSKLAENPNITYRQLGHAVLQQYQADSRQRPTPLFEGELDARVFGTEAGEALQQWPVQVGAGGATVPAGMLHRLSPGTRLAVLPSPLSTLEEAVGYLEVKSAKNLTSTVAPVAFDGKPAVTLSDLPPNAYARLAEVAVDFKLRVARPAETEGLAGQVALVNSTLDALASADGRTFNVELVPPGAEADIRLAVLPQGAGGVAATASPQQPPALFFLPPSGELETRNGQKPPRVVMDPAEVDRFKTGTADNLTKIFRATSLSRLAAASDYQPEQVSVQFLIKREGKDAMEPLDAASVPMVSPGDEVHILAENKSPKLVDINILYVGSDYSITHIDSQRLVSGAKIEEGLLAFTDESFGMERMIAVLTEAPAMSEVEDLSFLAQAGVPATRSASMTRGGGGFSDMLTAIGMAQGTRAVMKLGDKGDAAAKGAVMIFPMETMPRP